tara:strand:- start:6998 stop:7195 length:198 start_codon:yes stop_codon:yes gene_type:complete
MKARTQIQVDANRIDLDLFNLSYALALLSVAAKDESLDELALQLLGMRYAVRKHMHSDDIEETNT